MTLIEDKSTSNYYDYIVRIPQSKNSLVKESFGYIALWSTLLILSGIIVSSSQGSPAYVIIPFKIIVDLMLFLVAFYVQKNIIFNTN